MYPLLFHLRTNFVTKRCQKRLFQQPQPNCNLIAKPNVVVRKRIQMCGHNRAPQVMNFRTRFPLGIRTAFLEKTFNQKTSAVESKGLIEHSDVCQVSLKIRHLINRHSLVYLINILPSDIFCIWKRHQVSHQVYELIMVLTITKSTVLIFLDYPS